MLSNATRGLCLRTWTGRKTKEWLEAVQKVAAGDPGEREKSSQ